MADGQGDGSIAPRRSLGGPILPPPPPEMAERARQAEEKKAAADRAAAQRQAEREARAAEKEAKRNAAARQRADAKKAAEARREQEAARAAEAKRAQEADQLATQRAKDKADREAEETKRREAAERQRQRDAARAASPVAAPVPAAKKATSTTSKGRPVRRTRRAQLRLVQVDAWSVMKTAFLLSIALGIVLVVAVAIIWSVLGAAGVWDSINSIVQQAVGTDNGTQFDIQQYLGASRVLGFTMIVAVLDVILITAIATLGAFLYNLSAALLGGIEVTLAEDN